MIHPLTELQWRGSEVGHGVVASAFLPRGTVTWVEDELDIVIGESQVAAMTGMLRDALLQYCYRNNRGDYVLCWDHARYMNHSFRANCFATPYGFEIAVRDIEAGEELTNDYGFLNLLEPFRAVDEGTRRKVVYPDDTVRYHKRWDRLILEAMRSLHAVEQPLGGLIRQATWDRVAAVLEGKAPQESILSAFYSGESEL